MSSTPPEDAAIVPARPSRVRRILLVGLGLVFVGLGAVGAILPGLPTTIFLIGASWCFARSCPWLEEKSPNARLFRPFRGYMVPGGTVGRCAKAGSLVIMWVAITVSATLFCLDEEPMYILSATVVALGLIGSWFIVRHGNGRSAPESAVEAPEQEETRAEAS